MSNDYPGYDPRLTGEALPSSSPESRATPRPWRVADPSDYPWRIGPRGENGEDTLTIIGKGGYGVFSVPYSMTDLPSQEGEANLRLIVEAVNERDALISEAKQAAHKIMDQAHENSTLRAENESLKADLEVLKTTGEILINENKTLRSRLATLEGALEEANHALRATLQYQKDGDGDRVTFCINQYFPAAIRQVRAALKGAVATSGGKHE